MAARIFRVCFFITAIIAGAQAAPAAAQDAMLPGGATSLRESHDDWVVNCAIANREEQPRKICSMSQEQHNTESGQRILAIELRPDANMVTLVLPFGLDLSAGAALQINDGEQQDPLPFRTCLPSGCIISLDLDDQMLESLRSGTTLKIHVRADGGEERTFSISLQGFSSAFARTVALMEE